MEEGPAVEPSVADVERPAVAGSAGVTWTGFKNEVMNIGSSLDCKEDTVSPAFLIESADLKIVETVDGGKMVANIAIVFSSLVSVNNIQFHFEIKVSN
ncbi:hypothetical protein E2C01_056835 [Portunus trituberculatus]|uniref:Uncharacterized protein n=1 Tax=Portunus trituberculatus TaxID=210409 RepID=A0A5B7GZA8_PORTR|nr:hypothetical protein [Portunus trituberculatus]